MPVFRNVFELKDTVYQFITNSLVSTVVVHDFNGHGVSGMHGVNGKNCYDGPFYVLNNGKIHEWL